jgi:hypothetical protein
MIQASVPASAGVVPIGPPESDVEDRLDEALKETFPASDPVAIQIEDPADDHTRVTIAAPRGR